MAVLEISDLITDWDPATRARRPVLAADAVRRLREAGERQAARIVERMPAPDGVLDADAVDRLLVRVHTELQRLGEELHMVPRLLELLKPMVAAARPRGGAGRGSSTSDAGSATRSARWRRAGRSARTSSWSASTSTTR